MASRSRLAAVVASFLVVAAACGSSSSAQPAPGSDIDRPSEPTTESVRFADVATDAGLTFEHGSYRFGGSGDTVSMMTGGLCWLDYDSDGWLDLFVVNTWTEGEYNQWEAEGALPATSLWRNDQGRFEDVTDDTGTGLEIRGQGCVAADFDLDGHTDLFVTTARENILLRNDGKAFEEVDAAAGVDAAGWHTGAAVGDIDGDGWPDLYVAGYADQNRSNPQATRGFPSIYMPEPDLLYLNRGPSDDGFVTFEEVGEAAGMDADGARYGLGVELSDIDGDGDLDVSVANDTVDNRLYENVATPGEGLGFRLEDRAKAAGVADNGSGMGVALGDFDFDMRDDLVITNNAELHVAARNETSDSAIKFSDALSSAFGADGLGATSTGWGVSWMDLDLDTDLDLMLANGAIPISDIASDGEPLEVFANRYADGEPNRFDDVAAQLGLDAVGPVVARGLAAADYDNDGDLDVAVLVIGGDLLLLRNEGAGGHWLEVATEQFAPGTRVDVSLPDGTQLTRELHAGSSYLSTEDPRAHFGLGTAETVPEVRVVFPDGSTTTLTDVAADQLVTVEPS